MVYYFISKNHGTIIINKKDIQKIIYLYYLFIFIFIFFDFQ